MLRETRIDFIAAMSSGSNSDTTHLRLRLDDERKELWISDLRVAVDFRGQGIGRQLVRCAELLAQELEIPLVSLFPLRGSSSFWEDLGYELHSRCACILTKEVDGAYQAAVNER